MATVTIPLLFKDLTGGVRRAEVPGGNLAEIIRALDRIHPLDDGRAEACTCGEPEQRVVRPAPPSVAQCPQDAPGTANEVATDPEPAGRRSGDHHRLEQIPEREGQQQEAQGKGDGFHRLAIIPRQRQDVPLSGGAAHGTPG